MVNLMFIRFVCGEIDEDSHVSAGLFCAAFDLIKDEKLSDDDYAELAHASHQVQNSGLHHL